MRKILMRRVLPNLPAVQHDNSGFKYCNEWNVMSLFIICDLHEKTLSQAGEMDSRCNILKRNIHLCMSRGCAAYNLACVVQPRGIQECGKCLHLHVWDDGISCK